MFLFKFRFQWDKTKREKQKMFFSLCLVAALSEWPGVAGGAGRLDSAIYSWAQDRGFRGLDGIAVDNSSVRGLVARQPFVTGDVVLAVPSAALLCTSALRNEMRLGGQAVGWDAWMPETRLMEMPMLMLAAVLSNELARGVSSWWEPWLAALPQELDHPLLMRNSQVFDRGLEQSAVGKDIMCNQERLEHDFRAVQSFLDSLPPWEAPPPAAAAPPPSAESPIARAFGRLLAGRSSSPLSFALFARAAALVKSRTHEVRRGWSERGVEDACLVPLADMANAAARRQGGTAHHYRNGASSNIAWEWRSERAEFVYVARQNVAAGEALLIDYGRRTRNSNKHAFQTYGMVRLLDEEVGADKGLRPSPPAFVAAAIKEDRNGLSISLGKGGGKAELKPSDSMCSHDSGEAAGVFVNIFDEDDDMRPAAFFSHDGNGDAADSDDRGDLGNANVAVRLPALFFFDALVERTWFAASAHYHDLCWDKVSHFRIDQSSARAVLFLECKHASMVQVEVARQIELLLARVQAIGGTNLQKEAMRKGLRAVIIAVEARLRQLPRRRDLDSTAASTAGRQQQASQRANTYLTGWEAVRLLVDEERRLLDAHLWCAQKLLLQSDEAAELGTSVHWWWTVCRR